MARAATREFDVAIIGGGIVGLATARAVARSAPGLRVAVLEKERALARHQSGRNSGVLHSGLYYTPGSHKARLCARGRTLMQAFCAEHALAIERRGKLIVALDERERERLGPLAARAAANGVACERVGADGIAALEPHAAGLEALHVPDVSVLDYAVVCRALGAELERAGHVVVLGARVFAIARQGRGTLLRTTAGDFETRRLVACAGLQSDRVARLLEPGAQDVRVVPFRGEYLELTPRAAHLVRGLIYPVPDPALPFLGVHLTRGVDGRVECGPNAVLALAREGYDSRRPELQDLLDTLLWPGFLRLARRHAGRGLSAVWRVLSRGAFVRQARRLLPELRASDLRPAACGIRAQAVDRSGALVDDFRIEASPGVFQVLNAPSPAATSALAIGEEIASRLGEDLRGAGPVA